MSLHDRLRYDPDAGAFFWINGGPKTRAGARAGNADSRGYRRITVDGSYYLEHRLAWYFTHGKWPDHVVDHINGDKSDNRIANLRECSVRENGRNRGAQSNGISAFKGVSPFRGKWRARIFDKRERHLGVFDTEQDAARAYDAAARARFGSFATFNFTGNHNETV